MARKDKSMSMVQVGLIGAAVLALGVYLLMGWVLGDTAPPAAPGIEETADNAEDAEHVDAAAAPTEAPPATTAPAPASVTPAPENDSLVARSRSANLTGIEPVARPTVVATGDVVAYADLARHIGARIQVVTKIGTVRHGTLLSTNHVESQLRLDPADGGFNLRVPAETVAEVRLIPDAAN